MHPAWSIISSQSARFIRKTLTTNIMWKLSSTHASFNSIQNTQKQNPEHKNKKNKKTKKQTNKQK